MTDPNATLYELSGAMRNLRVASNILFRNSDHPRYRDLLDDIITKGGEAKQLAEDLLAWDRSGGFRPRPLEDAQ